tara:strand:- start:500 stop:964 length:465 start_codon:yes stop_codon:yes gene_type:complete
MPININLLSKFAIIASITVPLLATQGCARQTVLSFHEWREFQQSEPEYPFTTDIETKMAMSWSRIGPRKTYKAQLRMSVFEGRINFYGSQTCLGQLIWDDGMFPHNGRWLIVCPDESYASGNFKSTEDGSTLAKGSDSKGEWVTFEIPSMKNNP